MVSNEYQIQSKFKDLAVWQDNTTWNEYNSDCFDGMGQIWDVIA